MMIPCIMRSRSICFGAFAVLLLASFGCGQLSQSMHAPDLDTAKALWHRRVQLANFETSVALKSKARAMLQFDSSPISVCSWSYSGFGYLNCQPASFPSSVLKKVGKKGRFYKDYLQLADKCSSMGVMDFNTTSFNNTSTTGCPEGCRQTFNMCAPESIYTYFACPGSVAKAYLTCPGLSTESACSAVPLCTWDSFGFCSLGMLDLDVPVTDVILGSAFGSFDDTAFSRTTDLALWQKAYGKCPGSLYLFNRQVCGAVTDLQSSLGKADCRKFEQCEWIDDGKGVFKGCVRRKKSLTAVMYGGDPALSDFAAKCFKHDENQADCEAQT